MSLSDVAVPDGLEQGTVRVMQLALLGISAYGAVTLRFDFVLNGFVPLLVTFLPAYLRRDYSVRMEPGLVFMLTLAATVHAVGMLGPYQSTFWYDWMAHALSASVVALSGYAVIRALDIHSPSIELPRGFVRVFTVVLVVAFGGLWELFELLVGSLATWLGMQPPLIVYGLDDSVLDMVSNTLGGITVALLAPGSLTELPASLAARVFDR